jgi:hypothetical protein
VIRCALAPQGGSARRKEGPLLLRDKISMSNQPRASRRATALRA